MIGRKIQKICKKFNVKFLINDDVYLTKKLNADGCHLGQKDMGLQKARKILKWKPKENLDSLIDEMIKSEYQSINAIK